MEFVRQRNCKRLVMFASEVHSIVARITGSSASVAVAYIVERITFICCQLSSLILLYLLVELTVSALGRGPNLQAYNRVSAAWLADRRVWKQVQAF